MNRAYIYVMFLAIIIAVIYAYYSMPEKPATGMTYTPKEYIERLEQKKQVEREKKSPDRDPEASN